MNDPKNLNVDSPESLSVVMPNWLGDFVMALPALKAVRRDHPGVPMRLWAPRKLASMGSLVPWAGPITAHDGMRSAASWMAFLEWLRKGGRNSAALLFVNHFRAALISRMAGVPQRLGLATEGRGWLLTHPVKLSESLRRAHRSRWYEAVCQPLIQTPMDPLVKTLEVPQAPGEPSQVVALAVGAAYGPAKEYGVEGFRSIAQQLADKGLRPVVVGSASEWALASKVVEGITGAENMAGATSMEGLVTFLAGARGFIGNDSGPMHLAAALGVPTVGLFGSTDPTWTGPQGPKAGFLASPPPCAPCFQKTCSKTAAEHMLCMRAIKPDSAVQSLLSLIQ
ncbi:MAG: glycosyltransferase family 9 protein [Planctomycetota bacterium]